MNTKWILIVGDPIDGFFYYGPFDDQQAAIDYVEANHDGPDWWTAKLMGPTHEP